MITESDSKYNNLENKSVRELLSGINSEDKIVADSVGECLPQIEKLIEEVIKKLSNGGRLFYVGSGTSGRLGILDASECPPTFGVSPDLVVGIIAGGDKAIRGAVEMAEDDTKQGWNDLKKHQITDKDFVVGISASGKAPYVTAVLERCNKHGISTGCITSNQNSPLAQISTFPIEIIVGPEFVTGSTRMKSGTAQKMALNMITTATMIKLGKVKGNKMVNLQLTNNKLIDRGTRIIMEHLDIDYETANKLLLKHGSVKKALDKR